MCMRLIAAKLVEVRTWNPPVATRIADRPRASALSRLETRDGGNATTLLHTSAQLNDQLLRSFMQLLDGTRDQDQLVETMRAQFPDAPEDEFRANLVRALEMFLRTGLLEA